MMYSLQGRILRTIEASPHASANVIVRLLAQQKTRATPLGSVYTTLRRLEAKGFVASCWTPPTPRQGGRAQRVYMLTAAGRDAMEAD